MESAFELRPSEILTPISFREGGRKFRVLHAFRPPQFADWLEYETKLNRSVEIVGGQTRFDQERAEAAEAIWNRIVLDVRGYLVPNGSGPAELTAALPEDWREKVPLMHKMAAVQLLAQVFPSNGDDTELYRFDPDQIEVHLIAARGGCEYSSLVHTLKRPTIRQQKEFSRVLSTAFYVRGSRTEKSLLPSRLREMVKFYDELIVEARGYGLCVHPQQSVPAGHRTHPAQAASLSREDAVKWMDALHKQTAISALFSFEDSVPEEVSEP